MSKGELNTVRTEYEGDNVVAVAFEKKAEKPKNRVGRPSLKSPELITEILTRITMGQNLLEVCEADDMPHRDTVHSWLASDSEFSDKYVRACKIRTEGDFYSMTHIARTEDDVQRARLIIDTMKWQLSKEEPKKYGDKLDMTSGGEKIHSNTIVFADFKNDTTGQQSL